MQQVIQQPIGSTNFIPITKFNNYYVDPSPSTLRKYYLKFQQGNLPEFEGVVFKRGPKLLIVDTQKFEEFMRNLSGIRLL